MFIVLHCGGMAFNGDTIKTQSLGGSETAAYYLAKELAKKHNVTIFTNSQETGSFDGVTYCFAGAPSPEAPLGENFTFYAENTPHDVLIVQRHVEAFSRKYASKVNLLWMHDLGLARHSQPLMQSMWNIQGILCVSEYHKQQVCNTYGLDEDIVYNITNAVDKGLFYNYSQARTQLSAFIDELKLSNGNCVVVDNQKINLVYSSRPERGLENLVMSGGIMDKLEEKEPDKYKLYVCAYNHTVPDMVEYYQMLWQRCQEMRNVVNVGSLSKKELADLMSLCTMHVYPTTFEEVSCITAMEALAADNFFISSKHAALPETCKDMPNTKLINLRKSDSTLSNGALPSGLVINVDDSYVDNNRFVEEILAHSEKRLLAEPRYEKEKQACLEHYSWSAVCGRVEDVVTAIRNKSFKSYRNYDFALAREFVRNSDIACLDEVFYDDNFSKTYGEAMLMYLFTEEVNPCYNFFRTGNFKEHYRSYYQYEKDRGVVYGPENLSSNSRFITVASLVSERITELKKVKEDIVVLDYGCAHGHYTINLAAAFPDVQFIGMDISASNIETALAWKDEANLTNVDFVEDDLLGSGKGDLAIVGADIVIIAEVAEHVTLPERLINKAAQTFWRGGGEDLHFIMTTPYGPWEALGYDKQWPWRAHLHHVERHEIANTFGLHKNYKLQVVPEGFSPWQTPVGSFVYQFTLENGEVVTYKDEGLSGTKRKAQEYYPKQTVSLIMLAKDCEGSILKTLNSAVDVVDEVIIRFDKDTNQVTKDVVEGFFNNRKVPWPKVVTFEGESPLKIGFDAARNETIDRANCDWALMLDSDEFLVYPERLHKYLKYNEFGGYAMKQQHLSLEPVGLIKTDMPVRLFRNNGLHRYYGLVHEHPEVAVNEGMGKIYLIPDLEIAHLGYETEAVRRGRFSRNIDLMARDRERYPERLLGMFLWVRDLAQMCQFEIEQTKCLSDGIRRRAIEGVASWSRLLELAESSEDEPKAVMCSRFVFESIDYYSVLNRVLDQGFDYAVNLEVSRYGNGASLSGDQITGRFASKDHMERFTKLLLREKTRFYDVKYF